MSNITTHESVMNASLLLLSWYSKERCDEKVRSPKEPHRMRKKMRLRQGDGSSPSGRTHIGPDELDELGQELDVLVPHPLLDLELRHERHDDVILPGRGVVVAGAER